MLGVVVMRFRIAMTFCGTEKEHHVSDRSEEQQDSIEDFLQNLPPLDEYREIVGGFSEEEQARLEEIRANPPTEADLEKYDAEFKNGVLERMHERGWLKHPPELLPE